MSDIVTNIDTKDNNNEVNTIDISELGKQIGMEEKEQTLPNGKIVNTLVWDSENLVKAVEAVKQLENLYKGMKW